MSAYVGSSKNLKDLKDAHLFRGGFPLALQGFLAHKKTPPRRTLQKAYAYGPMESHPPLGGWVFSSERGTPVHVQEYLAHQEPHLP